MNPWMLLAQLGGTIVLCVGCWFYRGNIDATACKAVTEKMTSDSYESLLAYDHQIQINQDLSNAKAKADGYAYQKNLASMAAARDAASATSDKLQHALSLYAAGGWFKASNTEGSCVSVSDANDRVGRLENMASILESNGRKAANDAGACAVKLTACEAYATTVIQELGQ